MVLRLTARHLLKAAATAGAMSVASPAVHAAILNAHAPATSACLSSPPPSLVAADAATPTLSGGKQAGDPMAVLPIRVVSYNVRRFKAPDGSDTSGAIAEMMAGLEPSIVALNEVDIALRPEALGLLSSRLGSGFYVAFFGHVRGSYGNALLSRYPIVAIRETHLRGGTEVVFPAGTRRLSGEAAEGGVPYRIIRGLLECDIELPHLPAVGSRRLTVAVTHLDHISEEQREVQLDHVLEALRTKGDLLVGDLNALTRSDYSDEEWARLVTRHAERGWSGPTHGALDRMLSENFVDAFAKTRGGGPLSARPDIASDTILTAHAGHLLYRIDYCFMKEGRGLIPQGAEVHHEVSLSDHVPVTFDFDVVYEASSESPTASGRL